MSAHTPGMWTVCDERYDDGGWERCEVTVRARGPSIHTQSRQPGDYLGVIVARLHRGIVADDVGPDGRLVREEALANARLLAAAPDLLRMLEVSASAVHKAHAMGDALRDCTELLCAANRDAIAKARGETP